jgi:hypothetical protein
LIGEFIATQKNTPCANFYADHGFVHRSAVETVDSGSVFYEFDLTATVPMCPKWITMEGYESNEQSRSAVFIA